MRISLIIQRLTRLITCTIVSLLSCLFFVALFVMIYGLFKGYSPDNETLDVILLYTLLIPAPLLTIITIVVVFLLVTRRHLKILDSLLSTVKLGVIIGVLTASLLYPFHLVLFPIGVKLIPFA